MAEARSGRVWYRADVDGVGWSRDLWSSDLRLILLPTSAVRASGEVRQVSGVERSYTFLGASGSVSSSRAVLWASAGDWIAGPDDGSRTMGWGGGASYSLLPAASVWVNVRHESFDPFFLSTSRTSWGIGMSYRLGRARSPPPAAGPEHRDRGRVVLRLPLAFASSAPSVAGDFTGWEPIPMHRHGGDWRVELSLEPGVYHYAFRTADGEWFVPETVVGRRDDGMGGWVALLIVPQG